jgi:plasmid stabilization system protein ParE
MTKSIRIDAEADDEISHAIDRYEREREGLGAEFWDELKAAMRTLEAPGPECGPVIGLPRELGVRRKLLARFPYAIVFVESDVFVRVISVMHGHRRPVYAPPSLSSPRFKVTATRSAS